MHLVSWFPGVVTSGVALPLYEILEHSGMSVLLVGFTMGNPQVVAGIP